MAINAYGAMATILIQRAVPSLQMPMRPSAMDAKLSNPVALFIHRRGEW
jgi:hypothetical protein